jgi:hypothetical protein
MHNIAPRSDAEPHEMRSAAEKPTRREAEQLLSDDHVEPGVLGRLLAAARTTGARADTAGLNHVLADFSNRVPSPVGAISLSRRTSLLRVAIARLAAAKVIVIVALVVLSSGGIALATTGSLPNPLNGFSHNTTPATESDAPTSGTTETSGIGAPSLTHGQPNSQPTDSAPSRIRESASNAGTAAQSPSLAGLCKSWLARPHDNGKADDSAAFSALIAAAGGEDAVDGYCASLLASSSSTSPALNQAETTASDTAAAPCGKKTHSNGNVTGKC